MDSVTSVFDLIYLQCFRYYYRISLFSTLFQIFSYEGFNYFHRVSDPSTGTGIIPQDIKNFPRNPGTSTRFKILSRYLDTSAGSQIIPQIRPQHFRYSHSIKEDVRYFHNI